MKNSDVWRKKYDFIARGTNVSKALCKQEKRFTQRGAQVNYRERERWTIKKLACISFFLHRTKPGANILCGHIGVKQSSNICEATTLQRLAVSHSHRCWLRCLFSRCGSCVNLDLTGEMFTRERERARSWFRARFYVSTFFCLCKLCHTTSTASWPCVVNNCFFFITRDMPFAVSQKG